MDTKVFNRYFKLLQSLKYDHTEDSHSPVGEIGEKPVWFDQGKFSTENGEFFIHVDDIKELSWRQDENDYVLILWNNGRHVFRPYAEILEDPQDLVKQAEDLDAIWTFLMNAEDYDILCRGCRVEIYDKEEDGRMEINGDDVRKEDILEAHIGFAGDIILRTAEHKYCLDCFRYVPMKMDIVRNMGVTR